MIWIYMFIKVVILIGFSNQLGKFIPQPTYEFRGKMMITEIQKFVGLIMNNSDNYRFLFPLQMLWIEKNASEAILLMSYQYSPSLWNRLL